MKYPILTRILFLGIVLLLSNCEREESYTEIQRQATTQRITFNEFQNRISEKNYTQISKYFQGNSSHRTSENEFIILTNAIVTSQNGNNTSYTFQVVKVAETTEDLFYNLIITINEQDEIIKSDLYEYNPSVPYNSSNASQFIGTVRTYPNHNIDLNEFFQNRSTDLCVVDAVGYWTCSFGNHHEPGECNGSWFEYNVRLIYGACSPDPVIVETDHGTGGNGPFDPTDGGGVGNENPDPPNDSDVDTSPTNEPVDYPSNIINCINNNNIFGNTNFSLSTSQEDWVNNTATNRELIDLWNFLNSDNCGQDVQEFALEAIDALEDGGKVDYEDGIINRLTNECAKEIFSQLREGIYSTDPIKPEIFVPNNDPITLTFSQAIIQLFDDHITNLRIENGTLSNPDSNATTFTIPRGASIKLSDNYLNSASKLSIARTMIHELVHAYILRQYSMDYSFQQAVNQFGIDHGFNPNGSNEEQNRFHHEFMGKYIDAIAYSLYEWDKEYGTGNDTSNIQSPDDLLG
jgi:hypothetical protein